MDNLPEQVSTIPFQLQHFSIAELLTLHSSVLEALRERQIVRSANNPTGDLAEYLFCKAFDWQLARNSERGFDATSVDRYRYQIKGRRIHQRNKSRQLSAIRDLNGNHFDELACVLFDDNFKIIKAALIPISVVKELSTFSTHTNSNKFMLRDDIWNVKGVRDVTCEIISAMRD